MNREIHYTAQLYSGGTHSGQIVVRKREGRAIRCNVGGLTKATIAPRTRTWPNTDGTGIAIDLTIPEDAVSADHWEAAEAALRSAFPGVAVRFEP